LRDSNDGFDFDRAGSGILHRIGKTAAQHEEHPMSALYIVGALIAAGLLVYLFVALLWPEMFP
jgi:K+-transporting ATPase KdpF subunit